MFLLQYIIEWQLNSADSVEQNEILNLNDLTVYHHLRCHYLLKLYLMQNRQENLFYFFNLKVSLPDAALKYLWI